MWRLDLLEVKFNDANARFPHTKKLIGARNNDKLLRKLPKTIEEAHREILALKKEYFDRKFHGSYKKLDKEVRKQFKSDLQKLTNDNTKSDIVRFFETQTNVDLLIRSRLIKCIVTSILTTKQLKESPYEFIDNEISVAIVDKNQQSNPTNFFKTYCQNNNVLNNYISSLWNKKNIKAVLEEIEWAFKMVRGNLTKEERASRGKTVDVEEADGDSDSEQDSEDSESEADSEEVSEAEASDSDDVEMDIEEAYEKFAVYDKLVGDSEEEEAEEEQFDINPNVNYNEVTDDEPSGSDSNDSEDSENSDSDSNDSSSGSAKKSKADKYNLPELASGYFSGGSDDEDDDIDNDSVVKEITTQRKNRRGQRARQKIWAQKYGKEAKHIKEEQQKAASEREIRRLEYEERKRKREAKAALANAPSGANVAPLGERKSRSSTPVPVAAENNNKPASESIHPSWQAKKIAEEKLKNVKFTGKKITFD
ncbi:Bud-site selection protein [Scheffersomyces amazonensis]|uniref:Bud-site selection protein n=1 Tax=Scheffersomyces amazonensis TaxID=1078765 RepID=UPI00315CD5A3